MQRAAPFRGLARVIGRPQSVVRRPYSTPARTTPPPPPSSGSAASTASTARTDRILSRLPPSMQRYTSRLKDAPVSHVVAFLILHELTAIVPVLGLFGLFHYLADNNPVLTYMVENYSEQVEGGVARFERYFRKKGWLSGDGDGESAATEEASSNAEPVAASAAKTPAASVLARWSDARYRIVVEVGLAYAITKLLLPVRIAASLSATPWFAGVLQKLRKLRK
ncbi:mitochondrial seryl-trna synthetase [Ophiostoma piceae UAMH 11346]|uniref:Mitochondrial seryl-trna synthetase n=1 Tax=Ophiostoma piceae (strain UAMH 11346) TaxID=1262450 RepID=S3BQT5_OPHP1|nr:mitochondrial seryl-trna synthetase [Ophiostoma piceae UAMH 11346]